ncbi:hypothetical protein LX76_04738 [Cereibacter changlensis]|uniref:Exopolysaccharide biosynthesis protein n=3 Tax=Cereibacter changlensis TaxID=402884 RepID=A0A2W7QQ12_9RHOB|nr:exopolysaccharide biosynthesis protein [Cereibacter changlensis]PZX45977.1 hypothetical protein LX76_04738 [Cereibacter changlensis]
MLEEVAADTNRDRVSVSDLVKVMDARAFGALLLLFALPNVLPMPPGTSGILGLPLVYLSAQMMLGQSPWLPRFIASRSVARGDFAGLVARASPLLGRAERMLKPRLAPLTAPAAERVLGALCLVLSIVLLLPIPLGNMLPAVAICGIAMGILERDGLWIAFGLAVALLSLVIVWSVLYALAGAAFFLFTRAFA